MNNPFIKDDHISPDVSINKLYIAKMPYYNISENLENKTAAELFSTELFVNEIKKNAKTLNLDLRNIEEKKLPQYLSLCLESKNEEAKDCAKRITKLFGERLAIILLTLKTGLVENKRAREDWTEDNWFYWSQLHNVILVGGLASGNIGQELKYHVDRIFKEAHINPYNIILNEDSENVALKGCTTYIEEEDKTKEYLIMDCGATFIKRTFVNIDKGQILKIHQLDKVKSEGVEWTYKSSEEEAEEALKLHNHILNTILDSFYSLSDMNRAGNQIIISIANYVNNGVFMNRGGYGKLRLLSSNYEEYLSDNLFNKMNTRFEIKFIHDGTAMAAAFKSYKNSVCISLGTHFGVGFPM
ncbi:MAG: hypothetical protein Q4F66_03995 [Clostridium sp.]|nr:hypothetical protein [Clostridium sp.]